MGALHVHEFMTLDGVIDAPMWTFEYGFDPKQGETLAAVTEWCRGILLGRTTYEGFAESWPTRTVEDDPGAPFFNDTTKYVVSGTLTNPTWRTPRSSARTTRGDTQAEGRRGRRLYTSGSAMLVRAMLEDGLVDELHLWMYPLTRGSGPRLYPEGATPGKLSLAACESYGNGVVYLNYRPET